VVLSVKHSEETCEEELKTEWEHLTIECVRLDAGWNKASLMNRDVLIFSLDVFDEVNQHLKDGWRMVFVEIDYLVLDELSLTICYSS